MIVVGAVVSIFESNKYADASIKKREQFKIRAITGIFISIDISEAHRGYRDLVIADRLTGDTINASFIFYEELKDKGIQKGDSISKRAQSDSFFVYKKIEGRYLECCAFTTVGR